MRNIVCVKEGNWPDGTGRGAEYVNILANSIFRNLPEGPQGRFICFTDDATGLDPAIEVRPLPKELKGRGWWNKLYLFKHGHFDEGDQIFFVDLDTVITGPLDDVLNYTGKFCILRDFYRGGDSYQSSFMSWQANHLAYVWEDYVAAGYPEIIGGDQTWLEQKVKGAKIWQLEFPRSFVSYKVHCRHGIPRDAKVCIFHGLPRPHEIETGWMPELWKMNGAVNVSLTPAYCNTQFETIVDNVKYSLSTGNFVLGVETGQHLHHAVIVGGGPSINQFGPELHYRAGQEQTFIALNNSWRWLEDNELPCHVQVMCDARPENAAFLPPAGSKIERWYATQCAKAVIEPSLPEHTFLWNCMVDELLPEFEKQDMFWIGFGSSVGLRSLFLMYCLGYREFHLYGFDSCYEDGHGHAYPQPLNENERVMDINFAGRDFKCAAWMVKQAEEMLLAIEHLTAQKCVITIHGDGLLPWMAKNSLVEGKRRTAADERAESILLALEGMERPIGAEIGVFAADLSRLLLEREDLTLYMVDSWKQHDAKGEYAATDFHGQLTQAQQDDYFELTRNRTAFAGHRAKVIRENSEQAAAFIVDASLDFVFLDADHTYDAVVRDIAAWFPKLKADGVFCGHDYDHPQFPSWGVKKAVDEFCQRHGFELTTGKNYTWFINLKKQREKKYA